MKLIENETIQHIINDLEFLQIQAFDVLHKICESYFGEVGIESSTAIDFCIGFSGCEMCNITKLYISSQGKLFVTAVTCEFGIEHEIEITVQEALEVLKIIISDAGELECSLL